MKAPNKKEHTRIADHLIREFVPYCDKHGYDFTKDLCALLMVIRDSYKKTQEVIAGRYEDELRKAGVDTTVSQSTMSRVIGKLNEKLQVFCQDARVVPPIQAFNRYCDGRRVSVSFGCFLACSRMVDGTKNCAEKIVTLGEAIARGSQQEDKPSLKRYESHPKAAPQDLRCPEMDEETLFGYREKSLSQEYLSAAIEFLESRYKVDAFSYNGTKFPITVLWPKTEQRVPRNLSPDELLSDRFDSAEPVPKCDEDKRAYIAKNLERGPVREEHVNFCMDRIDLSGNVPKIDLSLGLYYDNILTQYAVEWELNKLGFHSSSVAEFRERLSSDENIPLRVKTETHVRTPLFFGTSRCAAMSVSMMLVFKYEGDYYYVVRRRAEDVGVSPGMWHVLPAGMCEATFNVPAMERSLVYNLYRELLEELYGREEYVDIEASSPTRVLSTPPIPLIQELLLSKKAVFVPTGICSDLLNLRPEVCTLLFIDDESYWQDPCASGMSPCWEYEPDVKTPLIRPLAECERFLEQHLAPEKTVASGAACLTLGLRWLRNRGF